MDENPPNKELDLLNDFLAGLHKLPPDEAMAELTASMDTVVKRLDRKSLLEIRDLLVQRCSNSGEIVDLIDGNLALREIQGSER